MYLTRMELDTAKRATVMALSSPNRIHGAVESAFAGRERNLWRIDRLSGKTYLLLVSESKPDLRDAAEQFGTEQGWESRDYSPFLEKIQVGDRRRFRLTANPVVAKSAGDGSRGRVLAHVTVEQQERWLAERAEKYGFSLSGEEFSVVNSSWVSLRKGREDGRIVTFREVTFEGILTVADAELFCSALKNGIGREKAYGCGMLTVTGVIV